MKTSGLPLIQNLVAAETLSSEDLVKVGVQVQKDFELSGITFDIQLNEISTLQELLQKLSQRISKLIQASPRELMSLLYRVDIPESKVSGALGEYKDYDSSLVIAALILIKTHAKIELRKRFK